jgi:hypothetical protein
MQHGLIFINPSLWEEEPTLKIKSTNYRIIQQIIPNKIAAAIEYGLASYILT